MGYLQKLFRGIIATTVVRTLGKVETINSQSIRVIERDSSNNVISCSGTVIITDGGAGYAVGCEYIDTDASAGSQIYVNEGTTLSCNFNPITTTETLEDEIQTAEVDLSAANILAMNGAPVEVVAGEAGKVVEFLGATLISDFDTAAYTGGGNVSIIEEDGSDVSTVASAANSFGSATDELNIIKPLAATYQPTAGKGLMITNATGAFTDPGTAAGVGRLKISYRINTTGL